MAFIKHIILLIGVQFVVQLDLVGTQFLPQLRWPYVSNVPFTFPTPSPINVIPDQALEIANHIPLVIVTNTSEELSMVNTGKSVVMVFPNRTTSYMTGGVLNNQTYIFKMYRLLWNNNISQPSANEFNGNGTALAVEIIGYKEEYGSFSESLNFRDGIVIISTLVNVVEARPNNLFSTFSGYLYQVRNAYSVVRLTVDIAFKWFDVLSGRNLYYATPGSFNNPATGSMTDCATVVYIPFLARPQITPEQFEIFQHMKNQTKDIFDTAQQVYPTGGRPVVYSGPIAKHNIS